LKRFHPAVYLAMATALVILIDAAVLVVPGALADPEPSLGARTGSGLAAASSSVQSWFPPGTVYIPLPSPTPAPPTPTATPTARPTAKPTPRDTVSNARTYVKNRIGARQYACIDAVWTRESEWNPLAGDPNGAYGIPQAFPGTKMAAFGSNWRTSPLTQVKWGLAYVDERYGSACGAWDFWQAHGWY
jgi:hypothetical protein